MSASWNTHISQRGFNCCRVCIKICPAFLYLYEVSLAEAEECCSRAAHAVVLHARRSACRRTVCVLGWRVLCCACCVPWAALLWSLREARNGWNKTLQFIFVRYQEKTKEIQKALIKCKFWGDTFTLVSLGKLKRKTTMDPLAARRKVG